MILLDAYALVAFLVGGAAAGDVRSILRAGGGAVATANLAEALDVSERVYGLPVRRASELLDPLFESALTEFPLDLVTARRAAELRARHYHRATCPISLADAILIGSAGRDDLIATSDPDVLAVAEVESIDSMRLPGQG